MSQIESSGLSIYIESSGLSIYAVDYRYYPEHMEWRIEAVIPIPPVSSWPGDSSGCKRALMEAKDELDAFQQVNQWLQKSNEGLKEVGGLKL